MAQPSSGRIRVVARTRPTANFASDVIQLEDDGKTISVHLPKNDDQLQGFINNQQQDWRFPLDKYLHNASQEVVYSDCASAVTSQVMEGYNGTIMAYGQTGAGKTYTMTGGSPQSYRLRGIIPRAISQVFAEANERLESSITIHVSYLEIYNETIHDLLTTLPDVKQPPGKGTGQTTSGLPITEDDRGRVSVKGLTFRPVRNEEEALNYLFEGEMNRSIAEHALNKMSSRSHCIFTIHIESRSRTQSNSTYTMSKLNLVDLAGSERLSKTNSTGTTQREAMYINKSLTFLEQVIVALADKHRDHIPYRQSKLTHVLRDSLGGNCNTLMIANIWTEAGQMEETISTLKFSTRMMCVANTPIQNVQHDPELLIRSYQQEIQALKQELAMHDTLVNRGSVTYGPLGETQLQDIATQIRHYVDGSASSIEIVNVRQIQEVFSQFKSLVTSLKVSLSRMKSVALSPSHGQPVQPPEPDQPTGGKGKSSPIRTRGGKLQTKAATHISLSPLPTDPEEEVCLVGDSDGAGFALGVAPSSFKPPASPLAAVRKAKAATAGGNKDTDSKKKESKLNIPKPPDTDTNEEGRIEVPPSEANGGTRPSTPPPKEEAFEQFKRERGKEINRIFIQNKETFHKKKREAMELSELINGLKRKIDQVCVYLDSRRQERADQGDTVRTDTGGVVIDEEEFQAITQLKQLKAEYREKYECLQAMNAESAYCKQYVDQSRHKLLSEFESWYRLAFLGEVDEQQGEGLTASGAEQKKPGEYSCERFDKLQAGLLKEDPATTAFYNAQLRTGRRAFESVHKKPGQVTANVRNRPPGIMSFS